VLSHSCYITQSCCDFSTVNSIILWSYQSFCYTELNNFATVKSDIIEVSSIILLQWTQSFCYSAQSFYDFVSHSQYPVNYFPLLSHFVKWLSVAHRWVLGHFVKCMSWGVGACAWGERQGMARSRSHEREVARSQECRREVAHGSITSARVRPRVTETLIKCISK
jgi:hypothetical protein